MAEGLQSFIKVEYKIEQDIISYIFMTCIPTHLVRCCFSFSHTILTDFVGEGVTVTTMDLA